MMRMPLTVESPAFGNNQTVPERFTDDGQNVSPKLSWSGVLAMQGHILAQGELIGTCQR